MANLYFKVSSDVDKVIALRKEIEKLEKTLQRMDRSANRIEFDKLNKSLGSNRKMLEDLVTQAVIAGKTFEQELHKGVRGSVEDMDRLNQAILNQQIAVDKLTSQKRNLTSERNQYSKDTEEYRRLTEIINRLNLEQNKQRDILTVLKHERQRLNQANRQQTVSEEEITKILNTQVQSIRQAEEQNKRLRLAVKDVKGEDESAVATRKRYNDRIAENTEFIKRNTDAHVQQKMSIGGYKSAIKEAFNEIGRGNNIMKNAGVVGKNLGGVLKSQVSSGFNTVRVSVGDMIKGFVGAQAIITGIRKAIGLFKEGFNTVVRFEEINSTLKAVLGASSAQMKELTNSARRYGERTRYTATEVTELQIELAKLGFTQQEIIDSTPGVLKFAQAVGSGLGEAAALTGASIRAFEASSKDTEKFAASMASSTNKTALSFEYLKTALPTVSPVANAFNFTLEDTLALLGGLSDAGFDASSAATATRNILLNLADANGKLSKALGGSAKSLPELVDGLVKLRDKGVDLNETLELTDKRSVAAFNTFLSGADELIPLRDNITDVEKELDNMAETMESNIAGSVRSLKSAWDELMISFGKSTGTIKTVIDTLTNGLRNLRYNLASPDEKLEIKTFDAIELQKTLMREFNVVENAKDQVNKIYEEKLKQGIDADKAQEIAKGEFLKKYWKQLEEEKSLYEEIEKEKSKLQEDFNNRSFLKQALFLEKTNKQYKQEINLRMSSLADLSSDMYKNRSVIEAITGYDLIKKDTPETKPSKLTDAEIKKQIREQEELAQNKLESDKWLLEKQKQIDLESERNAIESSQKRLNLEEESYKKRREQLELNHRKELLAIREFEEAKRKEQIEAAKNIYISENKGSDKGFDFEKFDKSRLLEGLRPEDISKEVAARTKQANAELAKGNAALITSMLDQYKTYDEKRKDIDKKYIEQEVILRKALMDAITNEDIERVAAAINQMEKIKGEEVAALNFDELSKGADWGLLFGDLENYTTGTIKNIIAQLEDLRDKNIEAWTPEQLKVFTEQIEDARLILADRTPFEDLKQSLSGYKEASGEIKRIQEEINTLKQEEGDYTRVIADKQAELAKAENDRMKALQGATKALNSIGSQTGDMVNSVGEVVDMLGNFGVDFPESIDMALDGIGQMASGLEQIDLTKPGSIISGSISMMAGLGNTIAGLFGSSKQFTQEMIDNYNRYIDAIDKVVSKQRELLSSTEGVNASILSSKIIADLQKQDQATREIIDEWLSSKSGKAFSGGNWREADKALSKYRKELKALGFDITSVQNELLKLSGEDLEKIRTELPKMWADFSPELSGWLDVLIDIKDQIDEIGDTGKQQLTGLSLDSLKSSLDNLVTQADLTFKDIADSFEGYMSKAILNMVKSKYLTKALEDWYDTFAGYMSEGSEGGADLTKKEAESLRKYYEEIAGKSNEMFKQTAEALGLDLSSSKSIEATRGGFQTLTQDQGTQLDAKLTTNNVLLEMIREGQSLAMNQDSELNTSVQSLIGINSKIYNIADELRNIQVNSFMELQDIRENTGALVKPIQEMQSDISEMKQDFKKAFR